MTDEEMAELRAGDQVIYKDGVNLPFFVIANCGFALWVVRTQSILAPNYEGWEKNGDPLRIVRPKIADVVRQSNSGDEYLITGVQERRFHMLNIGHATAIQYRAITRDNLSEWRKA